MLDIIIIGGGTAGLTAAIYALRSGKKVLLLEKENLGGQIAVSPKIENYPGIKSISGMEFSSALVEQALDLGLEIDYQEIIKVEKTGDIIFVGSSKKTYECRVLIIASGLKHRPLGIDREESFVGNGISYCAICDGPFFAKKNVAVIGGGNSALQDALFLSNYCPKVILITNEKKLTAEKILIEYINKKENIKVITEHVVAEILGNNEVTGLTVKDVSSGMKEIIEISGVFVAIGRMPCNSNFANVIGLDDKGFIISDDDCSTSVKGIFAAGDARQKKIRQLTTAAADGTIAAISAVKYLDSIH